MVKNGEFVVPIVQQDLSSEETILQICFALETLERVSTSIFCQVESKLEKGRHKLLGLQKRCEQANEKLDKLSGIKKTTTVYCASKFPSNHEKFYDVGFRSFEVERPKIKLKNKPEPPKLSLQEKLKFYHVKNRSSQIKRNVDLAPAEGLGSIPRSLSSVGSLLLFNTDQNVYSKYKIVNPLALPEKEEKTVTEAVSGIEPPPSSISFSDDSFYSFDRNLFYSPLSEDVPDIQAPLDLPNLPGIAGDLRYGETKPEPPPSVSTPVPEAPKKEEIIQITSDPEPVSTPPLPILEPPRAPSPPPDDRPMKTEAKTENMEPQSALLPNLDSRASLMEAIRQAGGTQKLKETSKTRKPPDPMEKKTGNPLMDDLHAKLLLRRKGISGQVESGEGMVERIMSMIPPPPANKDSEESEGGEEWDD